MIRLCLGLGVTAVFAPPRETGFQAVVESFNARWQAKVWQRFHFDSLAALQSQSAKYAIAYRQCARLRIEAAPRRRLFARSWKLNLQARLMGCIIYLRRTDAHGWVSLLGHTFMVDRSWPHHLVRAHVDLTAQQIRFFALRRPLQFRAKFVQVKNEWMRVNFLAAGNPSRFRAHDCLP